MVLITPQLPDPHSQNHAKIDSAAAQKFFGRLFLAIVVWAVIVAILLPGFSVYGLIIGTIAPLRGMLEGTFVGVGWGLSAIFHVLSWVASLSAVSLIISSALFGAAAAWTVEACKVKSSIGRSFISTVFSSDVFTDSGPRLVCKIIVYTFVGTGVSMGFSYLGLLAAHPAGLEEFARATLNYGAGAGGPFGGGLGGGLLEALYLFYLFIIFIIACSAVIGAFIAGVGGVVIGSILAFSADGVIRAESERLVVRLFADYLPPMKYEADRKPIWQAAGLGMGEGIISGAISGFLLMLLTTIDGS
jgi:hypothetical protein